MATPRLRSAAFTGSYPFANVRFSDPKTPVTISLEAFNPMIPLETAESSLPAAILTYSFTSRASAKLDLAVAFSMLNPVGYDGVTKLGSRKGAFFGQNLNRFQRDGSYGGMVMTSEKYASDACMLLSMRSTLTSCVGW